MPEHSDRLAGILLGTAVGDAVGLAAEGLHPARIRKLFGPPWRHRFCCGKGMISDDTEHALMVAQSLLEQPDYPERFLRDFAWRLRFWILSLPAAVGLATLRACLKLWLGFPPAVSGVFSAGNGPAMRAAIVGGYFSDDPGRRRDFVAAQTRVTHSDPKAETGALAVAVAAAWAVGHAGDRQPAAAEILRELREIAPADEEWQALVAGVNRALDQGLSVSDLALSLDLGNGVSGYVYQTVPVAIYAWLRHYGDFRGTVEAALNCGGDTDTVGAITGALAGATVGEKGIPREWIDGIWDWPRSVGLLRTVAHRLASHRTAIKPAGGAVRYFWPGILPRNLVFLSVVLLHGLRRLLPPY